MLKCISRFFQWGVILRLLILAVGVCSANAAAAATVLTLSAIQTNVGASINSVAKIITDIATISGVAFVFAAFFKFHAHKQNPTQVPLSQGITLLVIGAGLAVFPHLIGTATKGAFGVTGHAGISAYLGSS